MDNTQRNTILIVDDEMMNLKAMIHILQTDYTIYTAKDGASAIEMAQQYMPDLILLDIIMPGMDGYEVLEVLKKTEKTHDIPVVIISGLSDSGHEEKGLALGTADYIGKPYTSAIVKLRVRNQIQIVNQIRTIKRMSMIDQTTDIPNRRNFDNYLRLEWSRAARENSQISILMIDIDHFKDYNDLYGHIQGDTALQTIAKVFTQLLKRPTDLAARWGGEEFAILLPNTDSNGALDVAEHIRESIENTVIYCTDGSATQKTISIGVNTEIPSQSSTVENFVSRADTALYNAKKTGRNRVCLFELNATDQ